MSAEKVMSTQARRLVCAVAVVGAVVAVAPVSNVAISAADGKPVPEGGKGAIRAADLLGGDVDATLGNIESLAAADAFMGEAPEGLSDEVGVLVGARDVRLSGSVAGYVVEGECEAVLDDLVAHMERRGWSSVALGDVDGATFLKSDGCYTWALATCTQVGPATSVVIRCA